LKVLPEDAVFRTSDPTKRYVLMRDDVTLLYRSERFTSCAALILAFVDALASPGLDSDRGRFATFVKTNFGLLYEGLSNRVSGKNGGDLLYDRYRNGLLHGLGPKQGFALCTDDELSGAYVGEIGVQGGEQFVGINVDRLTGDFLELVGKLADGAA
jgi:hypothetical protein